MRRAKGGGGRDRHYYRRGGCFDGCIKIERSHKQQPQVILIGGSALRSPQAAWDEWVVGFLWGRELGAGSWVEGILCRGGGVGRDESEGRGEQLWLLADARVDGRWKSTTFDGYISQKPATLPNAALSSSPPTALQPSPILPHPGPSTLLPLMRPRQKATKLRRLHIIRREHIIHVLLETIVIQLPPPLHLPRHLLLDILDILRVIMRGLKRASGIQQRDVLFFEVFELHAAIGAGEDAAGALFGCVG